MKKVFRAISIACALVLGITLTACSGTNASSDSQKGDEEMGTTLTLYTQAPVKGGNGIVVSAQNSTSSDATTTENALTIAASEGIIVQPRLESGTIHVTITRSDMQEAIFDSDVEGTEAIAVEAGEGGYDIATTPNGATGELTVTPQGAK